ncbi:MAG: sugar transferase [Fastidiosipilaceae bacterium]|jgi:lipopolysaccharide/colanic/teichoic acid biosynthesis glycosyltransferase
MRRWSDLPDEMRVDAVRPYYEILRARTASLVVKRVLDIVLALLLIMLLSPLLLLTAIAVFIDDPGPIFYRQERVTRYNQSFRIFKFRTMVKNADQMGSLVTTVNDPRISRVGKVIRRVRLDELPQLFNILAGSMTFVGTRPEVRRYVEAYTPEMYATLLLPAGVTSDTSILYKDEAELLEKAEDVDVCYINEVLPQKMVINLSSLKNFSLWRDTVVLFKTVAHVLR